MRSLGLLVASSLLLIACSSSSSTSSSPSDAGAAVPTPPPPSASDAGVPSAVQAQLAGCTVDPGPTASTVDPNAATDPTGGATKFTLDQAMAGFPPGAGRLVALISTEQGFIRCELAANTAPVSVANFVGLARGTFAILIAVSVAQVPNTL